MAVFLPSGFSQTMLTPADTKASAIVLIVSAQSKNNTQYNNKTTHINMRIHTHTIEQSKEQRVEDEYCTDK